MSYPEAVPSPPAVLRQAISGQRRDLGLAMLLLMLHQASEALVPVAVGVVVDQAVSTGDVSALVWSLAGLVVLFAVLSSAYRMGYRLVARADEHAAHALRLRLTRRVLDPVGGADHQRMPGELLSIATADAKRVGAVHRALGAGAGVLAALVVATIVLLSISLPLGLFVVLGLPPVLFALQRAGRPLQQRAAIEQGGAAVAAGLATDLVRGLRVLKGIGAEEAAIARYGRASRDSLRATLRAARAEAGYDGVTIIVIGAFLVLVTLVAGRLAAEGQISVGELIAALGLTQFLIGPLGRLSYVGGELARAGASADRVAAVLAPPPARRGARGTRTPEPGPLRFSSVTQGALRDLTVELPLGAFVGIVAEAHETQSLLECLTGDVDPDVGVITLGDLPLAEYDLRRLRSVVLVAPHDADLFEGTMADNVGGTAGRVATVLAASAADDVAAALPDGMETRLAERGSSLSGGQRQRVALARALAADPPVLVLHDPTTAVDAATEARIAAGVREIRRGRSTLVVTTSPALLAVADRVILLANGTVADDGPHDELVHRSSRYREAVLG